MLTQIYSPYGPIPNTSSAVTRDGNGKPGHAGGNSKGSSLPLPHPENGDLPFKANDFSSAIGSVPTPTDPSAPQGSESTTPFATVADQSKQDHISLSAILTDFRSTMDAMGVDPTIRQEVEQYLQLIDREGAKPAPAVPLIKQVLKTASDTLDQYISQALGQPSKVVREWVDALLLQKIQYQHPATDSNLNPESNPDAPKDQGSQESLSGSVSDAVVLVAEENSHPSLEDPPGQPIPGGQYASNPSKSTTQWLNSASGSMGPTEKALLKGLIEESRTRAWAGDQPNAIQALREALDLLDGKGRPDLEGKLCHKLGKIFEQQGAHREALAAYQNAEQAFQQAGMVDKQTQLLQTMARMFEKRGNVVTARLQFQKILDLGKQANDMKLTSQTYNELGVIALRQGDTQGAMAAFLDAHAHAIKPGGDPSQLGDIFCNLGKTFWDQGNPSKAAQAYETALGHHQAHKDRAGYLHTLQQLSALALEQQALPLARKYQQKAQQLAEKWGIAIV